VPGFQGSGLMVGSRVSGFCFRFSGFEFGLRVSGAYFEFEAEGANMRRDAHRGPIKAREAHVRCPHHFASPLSARGDKAPGTGGPGSTAVLER